MFKANNILNEEQTARFDWLKHVLIRAGYEQTYSVVSDNPFRSGTYFTSKKNGRRAVIRPATLNGDLNIRIEYDPVINEGK